MAVNSQYFFNGEKFIEYVDPETFKTNVKENMNVSLKEETDESFGKYYEKLIQAQSKIKVDRLLFNHILYGQLKHTYVHKLTLRKGIKESKYNENMKALLEKYRTPPIPDDIGDSLYIWH
ncbi:hypothetical protein ACOI1C_14180 [Bacillus sp. DJP31]|uniref:hypothetical protein n=1 Tax=Bacillus sp. DJP31 TaxID=3409789 RepID=UPI003BB657AF